MINNNNNDKIIKININNSLDLLNKNTNKVNDNNTL